MENSKHSAFPIKSSEAATEYGLTKREYFAGLAMQGLIANGLGRYMENQPQDQISMLCADAVEFSNELLRQLE